MIGDLKLIVIDNFFKHPDVVRNFAFSAPFSKSWQHTQLLPGVRALQILDMPDLYKFYEQLLYNYYDEKKYKIDYTKFSMVGFQAVNSDFRDEFAGLENSDENAKGLQTSFVPHTDTAAFDKFCGHQWATTIWLNLPEECNGGTAFWKNKITDTQTFLDKPSNEKHIPKKSMCSWSYRKSFKYMEKEFKKWDDKWKDIDDYDKYIKEFKKSLQLKEKRTWWTESNEYWELVDVTKMKYNRMILYSSYYWHNQYIKDRNWFIDFPRIQMQNFF